MRDRAIVHVLVRSAGVGLGKSILGCVGLKTSLSRCGEFFSRG